MNSYKLRLFADRDGIGKPAWEQVFRAPSDDDAILQAKERVIIPVSETGAGFVILTNDVFQTIWSKGPEDSGQSDAS